MKVGEIAPRKSYRTAQIKPATKHALMDVMAQAADASISLIEDGCELRQELADLVVENATAWDMVKSLEKFIAVVFIVGMALGAAIGWGFHA